MINRPLERACITDSHDQKGWQNEQENNQKRDQKDAAEAYGES